MTARNLTLAVAACLGCAASSAPAQDVMRSIEMPGHRALMNDIDLSTLSPFETDGCSGGMSASWQVVADTFPGFAELYEAHPPWEGCCVIHDRAYHNAAGAQDADDSFDARLHADQKLRACVRAHGDTHADDYAIRYGMTPDQIRSAHSITAEAMYLAVRFGGGPCTGLPWRWGFGFPGCSVFASGGPARE